MIPEMKAEEWFERRELNEWNRGSLEPKATWKKRAGEPSYRFSPGMSHIGQSKCLAGFQSTAKQGA